MIFIITGAHDSVSIYKYAQLLCTGPKYGSVQYMFSTGKMCKFNRTLYNTKLIQFARIPAEFVVLFIRYQYRVKIITFSIAAQYLLLIFSYSLRVQCLELCTACILDRQIRTLFQHAKNINIAGGVVHTTITRKIWSTESKCTIKKLKTVKVFSFITVSLG